MPQRYSAYFTVPPGRQSPPSTANSSASDTPILSTSKRQQPPSSHVSIQHPQGCLNPFKFSLNLVVNVEPMDNNEQQQRWNVNVTPNGVFKDGEDRTMSFIDNLKPIPKQPSTNVKQNSQQSSLNGSGSAVSAYHRNDNYGSSASFAGPDTPANIGAVQSDSRSSHDSSKNKRKIQTTGSHRYKNKKSLLSFASLRKPRSKSNGIALPDIEHFLLPRRLSFNESDRADVSESENMKSDADKTGPLDRNSLVFDGGLCPRDDVETNEVGAVETKSSFSHTSQDSFIDDDVRQVVKEMMALISPLANVETCNESENDEVFVGESTDSRSPQASLKGERKIQTTGSHRYKNKKSLLSFASLSKPRSKNPEIALPDFQHFLPPRCLSFNESDSESENMKSDADKMVPLNKIFRNSLVFDGGLCPRDDVEINEVVAVVAKSWFQSFVNIFCRRIILDKSDTRDKGKISANKKNPKK